MIEHQKLDLADFFLILWRRKLMFLAIWLLVMVAAVAYLFIANKYYKLSGTFYVGRFQGLLIEEGEYVAAKLRDYSFTKAALDAAGVTLDIPVSRLDRLVSTDVLNEVKKTADVGLVRLTVEYKDRQTALDIYKALADHLIRDHQRIIDRAAGVLVNMEEAFREDAAALRQSLETDQKRAEAALDEQDVLNEVMGYQFLSHTIAEKRNSYKEMVKDMYYLQLEAGAGPKTYVTRMSAPPVLPDEHFKPKRTLVLILGLILASLAATIGTLAYEAFQTVIRPRL